MDSLRTVVPELVGVHDTADVAQTAQDKYCLYRLITVMVL